MASKTNATGRAKKTNATGKKSAPKPKATGSKKSAEVGSKNPAGENAADGENAHNTRYKMRAQVLKRHGEVVKNYAALAGGHGDESSCDETPPRPAPRPARKGAKRR